MDRQAIGNVERAVEELEGGEPRECRDTKAKSVQCVKEQGIVNGIKGCRKVRRRAGGVEARRPRLEEVSENIGESSFSRMKIIE